MSEEVDPGVLERYSVVSKLGKGAYGVVWKVKDVVNGQTFALKKIFDAFQNSTDAQRTYREVMYLQHFNGHENIVKLITIIRAENHRDLYMVFELMATDLYAIVARSILKPLQKVYIVYQLFKALKFIHSAGIAHRDLKPSNMLLDADCKMKIGDFGLARSFIQTHVETEPCAVSDYIATRWYRAPEILLSCAVYSAHVDLWSAGCIVAELFLDRVLFPGKSTLNQLELIIELLGYPEEEDLAHFDSPKTRSMLKNFSERKTGQLQNRLSSCPEEVQQLVRGLLAFNPSKRISAETALQSPLFAFFRDEESEIDSDKPILLPIDDSSKLSLKAYRDAVYQDISNHLERTLNRSKMPQTYKKRALSISGAKEITTRSSFSNVLRGKNNARQKPMFGAALDSFSKTHASNSIIQTSTVNVLPTASLASRPKRKNIPGDHSRADEASPNSFGRKAWDNASGPQRKKSISALLQLKESCSKENGSVAKGNRLVFAKEEGRVLLEKVKKGAKGCCSPKGQEQVTLRSIKATNGLQVIRNPQKIKSMTQQAFYSKML